MNRFERITAKLTRQFQPSHLEVHDVSHKHAGHGGARPEGETHFEVVIESAHFAGMSKVRSHQAVYAALADELKAGLHALAIETRAIP